MEFQQSVIELIKIRKSCRTYDGKAVEKITLQKLIDYAAQINEKAKIKVRFTLVNNNSLEGKLGTYGNISGAKSFIAGILHKDEKDATEFGYLFEKIILFATDLGLQTCWLGGGFNRRDFKQNASILENEFIPIVSPVGIKKETPRLIDSVLRIAAGADQRKPWSELIFEGNAAVPLSKSDAGPYAIPLEMVRLAPSASNKQPWRIIKDNNAFHLFLCRTRGYGVSNYDLQKNDIGIAKCHFELSAIELGLTGKWQQTVNINALDDWEYITSWI